MSKQFFAIILLVLVSLVLCVRQLGEPDVWWQIRTGEYILEHGFVPKTDVFSYTYAGDPWFNVKWGTEVLMALVTRWLGPESLMLLHWLVLLGIMTFIYKSYRQLKFILGKSDEPLQIGFFLAMLLFLMAMAYRINARPEMMSHLLTAAYLYIFLSYYHRPGPRIWLLIPLQILWANLHEAFGVGQVLIVIFLVSIWYQHILMKKHSKLSFKQLRLASISGIIALIAVVIHPMGAGMLTHAFDIYAQLDQNKFTTELWNFKHAEYWNLAAYITLLLLVLLIYRLVIRPGRHWRSLPLFYLLILAAFIYLAASANRNLPFLLMAIAPVLGIELERWLNSSKVVRLSYFFAGIAFYLYVSSGKFYERHYPVEKYGLRVDMQSTPIGVANFILKEGLSGNAYVDYFSSSYLLWALQPEYKSYLDLRDLDVFESQFIANNLLNYTRPNTPTKSGKELFRFMEDIDHFNYVVMENNEKFVNFHRYMNGLDDYVLAYADPLSSLYIKDNEQNSQLFDRCAKLNITQKFKPYSEFEPLAFNRTLSYMLAPWYQPMVPTDRYQDYLQAYSLRYLQ